MNRSGRVAIMLRQTINLFVFKFFFLENKGTLTSCPFGKSYDTQKIRSLFTVLVSWSS